MEDVSHVLDAAVGDFDTDMCLICREGCAESFLLGVGEPACVRLARDWGSDKGDHPHSTRKSPQPQLYERTIMPFTVEITDPSPIVGNHDLRKV